MKRLILIGFFIFAQVLAQASETDNFTLHNKDLPDSTAWLNNKMNSTLDEVARKSKGCNVFGLQKNLYQSLGGVFVAKIENWSKENPNAIFLPVEQSIYADSINVKGTHGLRKLVKFGTYYLPGQFKIENTLAGDDKLGHFLQLGYAMFFAVKWKEDHRFPDIRTPFQKLAEVLAHDYKFIKRSQEVAAEDIVGAFANFQEEGEWGMTATLVKSYGDMASDYDGYLFWSKLTEGENPYFKCENKQWIRVREFNWQEYVSPAWDESINCSEFHPSIKDAVINQIEQRGIGQCPVSLDTCKKLVERYGSVARTILHPKCYKAGTSPN